MILILTGSLSLSDNYELVNVSNDRLLDSLSSRNSPLILRLSSLYELSRRKDTRIWKYIDEFVYSGNLECWLASIEALTLLGTKHASIRLFEMYSMAEDALRPLIVQYLGRIIHAEQTHQFRLCLRHVIQAGILDITAWNCYAISSLMRECDRFGIELQIESSLAQDFKDTLGKCATQSSNVVLPSTKCTIKYS